MCICVRVGGEKNRLVDALSHVMFSRVTVISVGASGVSRTLLHVSVKACDCIGVCECMHVCPLC